MKRMFFLGALLTLLFAGATSAEAPYRFEFIDFGSYDYGSENDVSSNGWSFLNMGDRTWLSKDPINGVKDGPKLPLPVDFDETIASAINDAEQVVGYAQDLEMSVTAYRPFVWDPPTGLWQADVEQGTTAILAGVEDYEDLFPEIAGTKIRHFYPQDISDDGSLIVGYGMHAIEASGDWTAWVWDETNHFLRLPVDDGFTEPRAYLIDEADGTIYGLAKEGEDWCKVKWVPLMGGDGVPVDIKPQSCPNPLNLNSRGVLPVAILGTDSFDVTEVDPSTVLLQGVGPLRWALEDVATPFEPFTGKEDCFEDCTTEGPDGYFDLTLKFDRQAVVAALGDVGDGECLVLELTGSLYNSNSFTGEDVVLIRKKGKQQSLEGQRGLP